MQKSAKKQVEKNSPRKYYHIYVYIYSFTRNVKGISQCGDSLKNWN